MKANGAVVDENGNVVSDASDYWKKVYDQAEPKVAKYLHADGTIDENPGSGGGADLEDNKQVSITENGTVEITPSTGKDGMKKVTANVNVSGGGVSTLYYVTDINSDYEYMITKDPATLKVGDTFVLITPYFSQPDYLRKELTVTEVRKDDGDDLIYISYTPKFDHDTITRHPSYSQCDVDLV